VKTEVAKICAILLGLVVFAAVQDMSGTVFGAKPPVLLVFGSFAGVPAAIAAGLFADALGDMPFGCSAALFALTAVCIRKAPATAPFCVSSAAALHGIWISVWGGAAGLPATAAGVSMALLLAPVMARFIEAMRKHAGLERIKESGT
jgi:hypothetical protein